jgi:hypothetical protein
VFQLWIAKGERSGLQTRIATTESVSLCAPQLAADVGSSVEPIVASFYSHQPAQAKKAEQSDPAPIVMFRCSGGSLIWRTYR